MSALTATLAQRQPDEKQHQQQEDDEDDDNSQLLANKQILGSPSSSCAEPAALLAEDQSSDTPADQTSSQVRPSRLLGRPASSSQVIDAMRNSRTPVGISGANQQRSTSEQPKNNPTTVAEQTHKAISSSSLASSSQVSQNKLLDSQQMHVCRLCDKLLSSSSSLDRHMLTHSGERPFVCKRCHMTFTTNGKLNHHSASGSIASHCDSCAS